MSCPSKSNFLPSTTPSPCPRFGPMTDPADTGSADTNPTNDPAHHTVDIEDETHYFAWPKDKVLLDALLDAGVDAPYSCHMGECGACQCTVEGGETHMLANQVLSTYDIEDDQRLACQTIRDEEGPYKISYWF